MAAAAIAANPSLAAAPWADLGTGSGALAIGLGTLLSKQQQLQQQQQHQHQHQQETEGAAAGSSPAVWAVDFSPSAAAYAAANAAACTPPGAVRVVVGSWWEPLGHLRGQLGGVLTNPPYIPRAQMEGLQREVGLHEPHSALDGGPGPGLDSIQVRRQHAGLLTSRARRPRLPRCGCGAKVWGAAWAAACSRGTRCGAACMRKAGLNALPPQVICAGAGEMLMDGGYIALEVRRLHRMRHSPGASASATPSAGGCLRRAPFVASDACCLIRAQGLCAHGLRSQSPAGCATQTAGDDQAARVKSLLESSGDFEGAGVVADCYGVGRFVEARRRRR
jgi:methylase of polypeptide subunit release factors